MDGTIARATQDFRTPVTLHKTSLEELPSTSDSLRGLKHLTSHIKYVIQSHEFITFDCIMNSLGGDPESQNTKRRVYDCLNVMEAARALRKKGKQFFWDDEECVQRKQVFLQHKRRVLIRKVQECVAVQNLVMRNQYQQCTDTIQLPFVVVCVDGQRDNSVLIERSTRTGSAAFKFNKEFTLKTDYDVLLALGLPRKNLDMIKQFSETLYEYILNLNN